MNFGFSYVGLIFLLMLYIPNIIWSKNIPEDYDKYSKNENKVLLIFERIGEVLVTVIALIFKDFNIGKISYWSIILLIAFLLLVLYEIYWIRYFKSNKTMEDMYRGIIGIPLAGATLPVLAFLLLGIYGMNMFLVGSIIILAIGHIGIHYNHRKEIKNNKYITINIDKEPYIKKITNDKVINLTGQSGSGKSTYASKNFNSKKYLVIDTDDILSDNRFKESTGINRKLGEYFRKKYKVLPNLGDDFDLVYKEILNYCKKYDETIVIDSAQFHCIKDISLLKGTIIIIRTSIDNCYKRTIKRYKSINKGYTKEELNKYKETKKSIYKWYKYSNEFINKIDLL